MPNNNLAKDRVGMNKRTFLARSIAAVSGLALAGCDRLSSSSSFVALLGNGSKLSYRVHRAAIGDALAQEFAESDLSPSFRGNGTTNPLSAHYQELARGGFADWKLVVDGLVENRLDLSLSDLRSLPSRTQITRHDCVEGWSAIGKWKGVPLARILEKAKPKSNAQFVVFRCADPMHADGSNPYYESIDMVDAHHPQTILAYELNDKTLPITNGAPIRLRVERQLGYKQAKYIMRIELVESFEHIEGGKGGYWEDRGYQWYGGL
jgi:DMSO/TMAO reductase YedYZ molybdopterin-dependent catalytic subunit